MSNSESFTNQQFYSLGLKFVLFTLQFFTKINFVAFLTQEKWLWMIFIKSIFRNQFLWNHSNASWQISSTLKKCFFSKTRKCKFGNLSCEVWANLLVRRVGGESSSRNFETRLSGAISNYLQSLSAFVKNFPTSNFWRNIWSEIFQLKHLTSNKCLLERPCIVNSKHLQTST